MLEAELQDTLAEAAKLGGWLRAHFRPARANGGWRTPVALDGATFYAQAFMVDLFANNFGLISSNGVRTRFSVPTRQQAVAHTGDPARTTGNVTRSYGIITYFEH